LPERQTNKQAKTMLARQRPARRQKNAGITDKQRGKHERGGGPEVVPVHSDGGVLAGSDEGLQVMRVHHGQHIAVMQRHLLPHPTPASPF